MRNSLREEKFIVTITPKYALATRLRVWVRVNVYEDHTHKDVHPGEGVMEYSPWREQEC